MLKAWYRRSVVLACAAALLQSSSASSPSTLSVDALASSTAGMTLPPPQDAKPFDPDGAPGWRMVDRFRGFRFQATLPADTPSDAVDAVIESTVSVARESRCFGWIQPLSSSNTARTLVGEARCPKSAAEVLDHHLHLHTDSSSLRIKEYANTKIRYHFPQFRVLHEPRYQGKTCFATSPHACDDASSSSGSLSQPTTPGLTKDEL